MAVSISTSAAASQKAQGLAPDNSILKTCRHLSTSDILAVRLSDLGWKQWHDGTYMRPPFPPVSDGSNGTTALTCDLLSHPSRMEAMARQHLHATSFPTRLGRKQWRDGTTALSDIKTCVIEFTSLSKKYDSFLLKHHFLRFITSQPDGGLILRWRIL